jgi:hypothetical protein
MHDSKLDNRIAKTALCVAGVAFVILLAVLALLDEGRWAFWSTTADPHQSEIVTRATLRSTADALVVYCLENKTWGVDELKVVWDEVVAHGLARDGWGMPLTCELVPSESGSGIVCTTNSAGPDLTRGTEDDLQERRLLHPRTNQQQSCDPE